MISLTSQRPLHELANRSAALLCRPLIEAIHEALPAELRDQVYDLLWDEDAIDLVDKQLALPNGSVQDERLSNDWVLEVPFFANAKVVGESFAREAATYFFRMVTDAEIDYRLVQAYLRMENFGNMSLRPREITRLLRIDLAWSFSFNHFAYADLQANLESLLDLPVRDDFAIEVFIPRDMQFSRTLFHILDIIKPIYRAFVTKGMVIKVLGYCFFTPSWRQLADYTDGPEPKQFCTTAELLNCYFDGTTEEWFTMKDAEIAAIKNPRRREKCLEVRASLQSAIGCGLTHHDRSWRLCGAISKMLVFSFGTESLHAWSGQMNLWPRTLDQQVSSKIDEIQNALITIAKDSMLSAPYGSRYM